MREWENLSNTTKYFEDIRQEHNVYYIAAWELEGKNVICKFNNADERWSKQDLRCIMWVASCGT